MRASQQTRGQASQTQRTNPRLIAASIVLLMPAEELQAHLEEELSLNPALEAAWDQVCPDCGRALANGVCWACRLARGNGTATDMGGDDWESASPPWSASGSGSDDARSYDPLENASAPMTLQEHVLQQARLALPAVLFPIAEYLVAGLNDDGLLETELSEAADALGVELTQVRQVLARLQSLDPPGVCARSVQESALLQLRELSSETALPPHIEEIVSAHWRDLANHSYAKIGRELEMSQRQVEEAVEFLRQNLCPYPGRLYHPPHPGRRARNPQAVRPDVIIRREVARYIVDVVRPYDFELRVSEAYHRLCATLRRSEAGSPEQAQAIEHYRRATWLVQSLRFREQTLRQIGEYVAEFQRSFLDTGLDAKMKHLTRTQVAEHIGKQVSTVSRAIAGKFVYLPTGDLVPFARLLAPAIAPKTIIADLLQHENPDDPLTDGKIARILRTRGFEVARRTIAKYRLALRLPSSVQRGRR